MAETPQTRERARNWADWFPELEKPVQPVLSIHHPDRLRDVRSRFLVRNGLSFYFLARVALYSGEIAVGCMMAQQAIELLIKAIVRVDTVPIFSHNLVKLLRQHEAASPYFTKLLADTDLSDYLDNLSRAYESQRYAESGYQVRPLDTMMVLDQLAFQLWQAYLTKVEAASTPQLYAWPPLHDFILKNNRGFRPEHISDDVRTEHRLWGKEVF